MEGEGVGKGMGIPMWGKVHVGVWQWGGGGGIHQQQNVREGVESVIHMNPYSSREKA